MSACTRGSFYLIGLCFSSHVLTKWERAEAGESGLAVTQLLMLSGFESHRSHNIVRLLAKPISQETGPSRAMLPPSDGGYVKNAQECCASSTLGITR